MANKNIIRVDQFCSHYDIEVAFIDSLIEHGLTEIIMIDETPYIRTDEIKDLEKIMRLHYDLRINLEGIDAISHLLSRLNSLQEEMNMMKNRLDFYEHE